MRRPLVLSSLLVATLGVTAGACSSGDDDPKAYRDDLIEEFQRDDLGFSEEQAECSADILIDVVGADELQDLDFSADEPPEELADAFAEAGDEIVATCDIDLSGE